MRPFSKLYTPAAASTTGFVTSITGAGPTFPMTTTTSGDSLAHTATITSAANLSAITFTLSGLDQDGNPQTEAITGPNATTVTGTKYWSVLNTVTVSATLGANTASVGWSAACLSAALPASYLSTAAAIGIGVNVSGTINYTVQYTYRDVWSVLPGVPTWYPLTALSAQTTAKDGNITWPVHALRLVVNSFTASATVGWDVLVAASAN